MKFFPLFIKLVATVITCTFIFSSLSAKDVSKSKDHNLVSRYPNTFISNFDVNEFEQYIIPLSTPEYVKPKVYSAQKTLSLEGKLTRIVYSTEDESSNLQIHKNYLTAFDKPGFEIIYQCYAKACGTNAKTYARFFNQKGMPLKDKAEAYFVVAKLSEAGKGDVYTVVLNAETNRNKNLIMVNVIETKAITLGKIETNIDTLLTSLDTLGKVEVYDVYFDTGQSDIKPESIKALTVISNVLRLRPTLSLYVVGHTDDTGRLENNIKLSTSRATAIVNYLVNNENISGSRLYSVGTGPFSPVASNDTVTGRAKNRRVELVKRLK